MNFFVHTENLNQIADTQVSIKTKMTNCNSRVSQCRKLLHGCLSISESIRINRLLQKIENQITSDQKKVEKMADTLTKVSKMYANTEKAITGQHQKLYAQAKMSPFSSASEKSSEANKMAEAIKEIKKILKYGAKDLDSKEMNAAISWLGILSSGAILKNSKDLSEFCGNLLDYSGDLFGFSAKSYDTVTKLLDKFGSPALKEWMQSEAGQELLNGSRTLSHVSSAFTVLSKAYSACNGSEDWKEVCRNFSSSTSKIADAFIDLMDIAKDKGETVGKSVASAYSGLGSMALYSLGYEQDHNKNLSQNVADLWMGAGASAGSAMISGATLGVVDLDVQKFVDHVNDNVEKTNTIVYDQGGPMWLMTVKSLACVPGVAAWSVGETVADVAKEKAETIKSLIDLVR